MTQEVLKEVTQGVSIEDAINYLKANELSGKVMLGVTIDILDGSIYIFQLNYWEETDTVITRDAMSIDLTCGKLRDTNSEEMDSDFWASSTPNGLVEGAAENLTASEFELFKRVKYFPVDEPDSEHFYEMSVEGAMREIFKDKMPEIKTGDVKELVAFERKLMELLVKINGSI